jgi:hypothetical protein
MTDSADQVNSTGSMSAFCAYAREDEQFLHELEVSLGTLKRQKKIDIWYDRMIEPGKVWDSEIDQHIQTADVILLLVSRHFLNSDYCVGKELRVALRRHNAGEARVIPIIVRPCEWKETDLAGIQALPKDGRPISRWQDEDEAWLDVTAGIRRAVESLWRERTSKAAAKNVSSSIQAYEEDPSQSSERLNERLDQLERVTRTAHSEAEIDRLSGGSLLTKHVMREDISRKACLIIAHLGPVRGVHNFIGIGLDLRNEGAFLAYDVKVMRDFGKGFESEWEEAAIAEIPPGETRSTDFRVPSPKRDESNTWYPQEQIVRLKVTFRDGLARRDEAIFTIKMHNQQSIWSPKEDKQAAQFSTYCAHLKPLPASDRRPRGLTEDEHQTLETLVRGAANTPKRFYPTILTRPCGNDMYSYQSEPIDAASLEPDEKEELKHDRDFLRDLVRGGYLRQNSADQFTMLEPLFRAYGFEPPS